MEVFPSIRTFTALSRREVSAAAIRPLRRSPGWKGSLQNALEQGE